MKMNRKMRRANKAPKQMGRIQVRLLSAKQMVELSSQGLLTDRETSMTSIAQRKAFDRLVTKIKKEERRAKSEIISPEHN